MLSVLKSLNEKMCWKPCISWGSAKIMRFMNGRKSAGRRDGFARICTSDKIERSTAYCFVLKIWPFRIKNPPGLWRAEYKLVNIANCYFAASKTQTSGVWYVVTLWLCDKFPLHYSCADTPKSDRRLAC